MIEKMGFTDYFLIVWDFIKFARDNGISVGPGRGSAAGSLAAYSLRITDVDPIEYKLYFERFLNPERISMPDIDIDFCIERRGEVIDYVVKKIRRRPGCTDNYVRDAGREAGHKGRGPCSEDTARGYRQDSEDGAVCN